MAEWIRLKENFNIFRNEDKKTEKFPDWTGTIVIDGPFINEIVNAYKESQDKTAKVKIAFWDSTASKSGKEYFNAQISMQKPEAKEPEPQLEDDEIPF
tara:strand:- start:29 stop:322 length:294 start_codon:yes stop_codon:yes gene_type:complete